MQEEDVLPDAVSFAATVQAPDLSRVAMRAPAGQNRFSNHHFLGDFNQMPSHAIVCASKKRGMIPKYLPISFPMYLPGVEHVSHFIIIFHG